MGGNTSRELYERFGLRPVINASGYQTLLGGSRVPEAVQEAMNAANGHFVEMETLLKETGERIADMLGAEAALVTPGCAAALALSTVACMAGSDGKKINQLPDTTGMPGEFLIQKRQRYHYDRCLTVFGGRLVEVGDHAGTTSQQLEEAISTRTAAVHYYAPGGQAGVLSPEDVIRVAHGKEVPVMVDAASQIYPLERMRYWPEIGMDLVGYGAKYFGSCHSSGILCGKKDLVDAAFLQSFIGYEASPHYPVGRPLKVDRHEVLAVVVALQTWLETDHEARLADQERKSRLILDAIGKIDGVSSKPLTEERSLGNGVRITVDETVAGKSAERVIAELKAGEPCIWTRGQGDYINVAVANLEGDETGVVAARLKEVLVPCP